MKKQLTMALVALLSVFKLSVNSANAQISFAPYINYPLATTNCDNVTTGDFNSDGIRDVAIATGYKSPLDSNDFKLFIYLQDSLGNLGVPTVYPFSWQITNQVTSGISSGDLNNDGLEDIVVTIPTAFHVFYQNQSGSFDPEVNYPAGSNALTTIVEDVDNDGYLDVASFNNNDTRILFSDSMGQLTPITYNGTLGTVGQGIIGYGSLYPDTLKRLMKVTGGPTGHVRFFHFDPISKNLDTVVDRTVSTQNQLSGVAIHDFDMDGINDLIISCKYCNPYSYVGIWKSPIQALSDSTINVPGDPTFINTADLDGDSVDEIIVINDADSVNIISHLYGLQSFRVLGPNGFNEDGFEIADINSDGRPDILTANTYSGFCILYNTTSLTNVSTAIIQSLNAVVYPNPTTGQVTVELKGVTEKDYNFSVQTITSQEVFRQKIVSEKETFFVPVASPGVYIGNVSDGNQIMQRTKIVFLK